jgi:hypothetical protein
MASNKTKLIYIRVLVDIAVIGHSGHAERWHDEGTTGAEAHDDLHALHGSGANGDQLA